MKSIGSILFLYGAAAIIMNFFNVVPRLLVWIYNWGEGTAWAIKIALVVLGGILWFMGKKNESDEEPNIEETKPDQNNIS